MKYIYFRDIVKYSRNIVRDIVKYFLKSQGLLDFLLARIEIIFLLCFSYAYTEEVTPVTISTLYSTVFECNGNFGNVIGVSTAAAISLILILDIILGSKKVSLSQLIHSLQE